MSPCEPPIETPFHAAYTALLRCLHFLSQFTPQMNYYEPKQPQWHTIYYAFFLHYCVCVCVSLLHEQADSAEPSQPNAVLTAAGLMWEQRCAELKCCCAWVPVSQRLALQTTTPDGGAATITAH